LLTIEGMECKEEFLSPRTPPARNIGDDDDVERHDELEPNAEDSLSNSAGKGRRRHRRAKGRKRKQKSSLMITNDDGSEFNGSLPMKQSKIALRPTNPLLNAPRNSTQFIIDDHENSNLFWNFEVQRPLDLGEGVHRAHDHDVYPGQYIGAAENERYSPDDECFWEAYSERDFEEVYETAHQEDVNSWDKERIVREIAVMEKRQKHLIEMLATIDPIVYLEKLQAELLSLQEVNRELKLVNIAEKLHRQERLERGERDDSSDSDSRLPDSTSQEGERLHRRRLDSDDKGGCSSGCCLKDSCDESCELDQELSEDEDDVMGEDEDSNSQDNLQLNGDSLVQSRERDVQEGDSETVQNKIENTREGSSSLHNIVENLNANRISEGEKRNVSEGNSNENFEKKDDSSNTKDNIRNSTKLGDGVDESGEAVVKAEDSNTRATKEASDDEKKEVENERLANGNASSEPDKEVKSENAGDIRDASVDFTEEVKEEIVEDVKDLSEKNANLLDENKVKTDSRDVRK